MALFGDALGGDDLTVQVGADTDNAVRSIDGLVGSLTGLGAKTVAVGAIIAGLGVVLGEAVQAASEWEDQLVGIAKVTDEATAEELNENLLEMGETLPVATSDLADVAEMAGRLGIEGVDNIERFTRSVTKIGVATDLTAEEAAEAFARMSNAFGISTSEIENMGSSANELSNNFAASTSEIISSAERAAPAAAQLGVEFEDLVAMQTVLIASGMQVERSGTQMNRALTKLAQNGEEVAAAMGMTNEEFSRMIETDPTGLLLRYVDHLASIESRQQRVTEATELFGSAGAKVILTLAENQDELDGAIRSSNEAYIEGTSVTEEFEKANTTFSAAVQRLENNLFQTAVTTGEVLLPALTDVVNRTNLAIERMQEWGGESAKWLDIVIERWNNADQALKDYVGTMGRLLLLGPIGMRVWTALEEDGGPDGITGDAYQAYGESFAASMGGASIPSDSPIHDRIAERNRIVSGGLGTGGGVGAAGGTVGRITTKGLDDDRGITVETTPEIRRALESGVPGYVSDSSEIGDETFVTGRLIEAVSSSEGGVTPGQLGLSQAEFNALLGGGSGAGGGGGTGRVRSGGVSINPAISNFGDHIDRFGKSVDKFSELEQWVEDLIPALDEFTRELRAFESSRSTLAGSAVAVQRRAGRPSGL